RRRARSRARFPRYALPGEPAPGAYGPRDPLLERTAPRSLPRGRAPPCSEAGLREEAHRVEVAAAVHDRRDRGFLPDLEAFANALLRTAERDLVGHLVRDRADR